MTLPQDSKCMNRVLQCSSSLCLSYLSAQSRLSPRPSSESTPAGPRPPDVDVAVSSVLLCSALFLQLLSQESRVVGESHLPRPPGHAVFDAAQDTTDLLGCKHTLLAHVQLFIHHNSQVFCSRAAFSDFSQFALMPGIALTQVRHLVV